MKLRLRIPLALFLIVLLQLILVVPVSACLGRVASLEDRIPNADNIVVGVVVGSKDFFSGEYLIHVDQYLKGSGVDRLVVNGFGTSSGDCKNAVRSGERWLFFIDGNAETDAVLKASYAATYDAIIDATEENIATIVAITKQSTIPRPITFSKSLEYIPYSPLFYQALFCGLPLLVVIGIGTWLLRSRRSKKVSSL